MINEQFSFFGKFTIALHASVPSAILAYFKEEYTHHPYEAERILPRISLVEVVEKIVIPQDSSVLIDQTLYYQGESIYFVQEGFHLSIVMARDCYVLCVEEGFDPFTLFYLHEVLMRYYATAFGLLFLHASAFSYQGACYVINAFGGTGKTNLLLDILERGGEYLADDLTVVDQNGVIYPYRKRINLLYYNFHYKPLLLKKTRVSQWRLKLLMKIQASKHSAFLYRFLLFRIEWRLRRVIDQKVDYRLLYPSCSVAKLPDTTHFIWLERTEAKTGFFEVERGYLLPRLKLCLALENRTFLDFDGYFSLVSSDFSYYQKRQSKMIDALLVAYEFSGVKKQTGDEQGLFHLIDSFTK